jgi:uncharacterized protein (TIGR02996 family)
MEEREGFLRAIREEPDDDVHRLVFADWLEDHDEAEWAALIRHQCGLARLLEPSADPFAGAGAIDIASLMPDLRNSFLRGLAPFLDRLTLSSGDRAPQPFGSHCRFYARRGLIEHLRLSSGEGLDALLAVHDQTRGDWGRSLRYLSFGAAPGSPSWHTVFPLGRISHGLIGRLLRSRHLSNFDGVDLRVCGFNARRQIPLPRRWPPNTRLWVHGRGVGLEADLARLRDRVGPSLVVEPPHPGDRVLTDDEIPF